MDFFWSLKEVEVFDDMWRKDFPLTRIAEEMDRSETAVLFLSFDRMLEGEIQPRKGWKIW